MNVAMDGLVSQSAHLVVVPRPTRNVDVTPGFKSGNDIRIRSWFSPNEGSCDYVKVAGTWRFFFIVSARAAIFGLFVISQRWSRCDFLQIQIIYRGVDSFVGSERCRRALPICCGDL